MKSLWVTKKQRPWSQQHPHLFYHVLQLQNDKHSTLVSLQRWCYFPQEPNLLCKYSTFSWVSELLFQVCIQTHTESLQDSLWGRTAEGTGHCKYRVCSPLWSWGKQQPGSSGNFMPCWSVHLSICRRRRARKRLRGMGVVKKIYCFLLQRAHPPRQTCSHAKRLQQNRTATAAPLQLQEEQWSLLTKVMPSAAAETFTEPWREGHPAPCCTLTRSSCSFTGREMEHVNPLVVEAHPIYYHGNRWKHQDLCYKPRGKDARRKEVCYWVNIKNNLIYH